MSTMHLAKNTDYLSDLQSNSKFPQIIRSLEQKFKIHFNLAMIRALALIAVQTTTVTLTGTAPDGNYTYNFTGTMPDGTPFDIDLDPFAASGNTNNQISTGLEAVVAAARLDELEGIITDESVSTNIETIVFAAGVVATVSLTVPVGAVATIARSHAAVVNEATRLRGWPAMAEFYEEVLRGPCLLHRVVAVAGLAAVTIIVGDSGDDNGLLTSTSLATTGTVQTTGAAENSRRREAAFHPQLIITATTDPFSSATAGEFEIEIEFTPIPYVIT